MKKPLTKSERLHKLYIKFYKQQRTLYLKQFKELAEFHQIEDKKKIEKKIFHNDKILPHITSSDTPLS